MAEGLIVPFSLLLGLLVALAPTAAQDCSPMTPVPDERGKLDTIHKFYGIGSTSYSKIMFVQPGADFQGIRVEAMHEERANETLGSIWVSLKRCNLDSSKWTKLEVNVTIYKDELDLILSTGTCLKNCTKKIKFPFNIHRSWMSRVVAHGFLMVKHDTPTSECLAPDQNLIESSCTDLPPPYSISSESPLTTLKVEPSLLSQPISDASTELSSTTVATIVSLVMVVVVVVAVQTVLVYMIHRRKLLKSQAALNQSPAATDAPRNTEAATDTNVWAYRSEDDDLYLVPNEAASNPRPQKNTNQNIDNDPLYVNLKEQAQQANHSKIREPKYVNIQKIPQLPLQKSTNDSLYLDMNGSSQRDNWDTLTDSLYVDMQGITQKINWNTVTHSELQEVNSDEEEPFYGNIGKKPQRPNDEPLYTNM